MKYTKDFPSFEEAKEAFVQTLSQTKRPGIDKVLKYLEKTDFYTAPASLTGHASYPSGLLHHSLNVYESPRSMILATDPSTDQEEREVDEMLDSAAIVGLLHGISLTNSFMPVCDDNGNVTGYTYNPDRLLFGPNGVESVYILQGFGLKLSREEAFAIRSHTAESLNPKDYFDAMAMVRYRLARFLNRAYRYTVVREEYPG